MNRASQQPTALALIVISIVARLLPHPANLTPVGGASLFGGAKLSRPWNYLVPISILFVSDIFLGFHSTMPYVYLSFLISVYLGEKLLRQPNLGRIALGALASSFIFFVISNLGVWLQGSLYPHSLVGLVNCYTLALPFWRNMLAGDLIFSFSLFYAYQLLSQNAGVIKSEQKLLKWLTTEKGERWPA